MKSETKREDERFTGFGALFSDECKQALDLSLIGLLNKGQPRFTDFRQVYRFPAILYHYVLKMSKNTTFFCEMSQNATIF